MRKRSFFWICGLLGLLCMTGCKEKVQPENPKPSQTPLVTEAEPTRVPESTKKPELTENSAELSFSFYEEIGEAVDGEMVYFTSGIYYPVFSSGNGAEAVNGFVETMLETFRAYLPEAEEHAKYDYEEYKKGEYPDFMFPEVQEYTVSVLWQDKQRIALYVQDYSEVGGVHPNTFGVAHVINKADGTAVACEAVLAEYNLTVKEVADFAANRIRETVGDELYAMDNEETLTEWVSEFLKGNQWYVNEDGLMIFANPYDIAPYAYGVIECEISYEELEQGLKKD